MKNMVNAVDTCTPDMFKSSRNPYTSALATFDLRRQFSFYPTQKMQSPVQIAQQHQARHRREQPEIDLAKQFSLCGINQRRQLVGWVSRR